MPPRTPKACRVRCCRSTTTDPSGYCESHKGEGWKQYKPGQTRHQRGYRPMAVQQTGQATGASCIARAEFEARQRAARTDETTYTVWGWRQGDGTLWQPNQRVIVYDPICGFNNRELLISEVSFTKDNNGTLTELRVGPPDAYLPEPEDEKAKGGKKRKVKEDPF